MQFANFDAISRIKGIDFFSKNVIVLFLNSAIILLLVLSAAGISIQVTKQASSFSFVIAVDNSESMLANDFSPDRITVAKDVAKEFIDLIPQGARVGVISFSGSSYIELDITNDKIAIKNAINNIDVKGWGGTDIYEAVITSANMLNEEDNKAIVLLSDGQLNVGNIDDIIEYAQKKDILINTIAIGTEEGGKTPYAVSKLDKDSLNAIAYNTGGKYFLAENRAALKESISEVLDITERKVSIKAEDYTIIIAIILFTIEVFLVSTRYLNLL